MNTPLKPITFFVEGKDDIHFLNRVIQHHFFKYKKNIDWSIILLGSKDGLEKTLTDIPEPYDGLNHMVIILDLDKPRSAKNDNNIKIQKQKIEQEKERILRILKTTGFLNYSHIKISIFFLPNNQDFGMLEDILLKISYRTKDIEIHIEDYFREATHKGFVIKNLSKSKLQAFLSIESGRGKEKSHLKWIESAILEKYDIFDFNHESLNPLIDFLTTVFSENPTQPQDNAV